MFIVVLKSLITLLICMLAGFICYKRKIIDDRINAGLSNLLVMLVLPSMIIYSMQQPFSHKLAQEAAITLVTSAGMYLSGTLIGLVLCKLLKADSGRDWNKKGEKGVWLFSLMMPNIVYMGYPVISSALGEGTLFYVSIASVSFNTIAFSLGIRLIALGRSGSNPTSNAVIPGVLNVLISLIKTNAIIAIIIGFLLFMFSIELPSPVNDALSMIAGLTTPISMIIIGAMLARGGFLSAFKDPKLLAVVFARLILMPILTLLLLKHVITDKIILDVLVLMAAMPAASVTAIFAEKYGGNARYASNMVFASTILSVITIPLVSLLI